MRLRFRKDEIQDFPDRGSLDDSDSNGNSDMILVPSWYSKNTIDGWAFTMAVNGLDFFFLNDDVGCLLCCCGAIRDSDDEANERTG